MKKFLRVLGVLFLSLLIGNISFADSDYVVTEMGTIGDLYYVELKITADASAGTVDDITIVNAKSMDFYQIETWPGTPAPKDKSDLTLNTSRGNIPLLGGLGTDLIDSTTPLWTHPRSNHTGITGFPSITGNIKLSITQQGTPVPGAVMNVKVIFKGNRNEN